MACRIDIPMREVAEKYGHSPNNRGYLKCPFHSERSASLKIYDNSFYCFSCGADSSPADFVMRLFNLDYKSAAAKLEIDFGLKPPENYAEYRKAKEARAAVKTGKTELERLGEEWNRLADLYALHDWYRQKYAPHEGDEKLHPAYIRAVCEMPRILYELENIQYKETELKKRDDRPIAIKR